MAHSRAADETATRPFAVLGRQLPFALVFTVLVVSLTVLRREEVLPDALLVAIGIGFAALVLAAVLPWHTLPRWAEGVVPLLDMAAVVGVMSAGIHAAVLIVLPVLWLARMGRPGAVVAVVAGILASTSVDLLAAVRTGVLEVTAVNAARIFILPTVVVAVAVSLHLAERRSASRLALIAGQGVLVEELLEQATLEGARLEGVLNTIDTAVAVLDREGRVVIANRALRRAAGGHLTVGTPLPDLAPHLYAEDGVTPLSRERLAEVVRGETVARRVVWWEHGPDHRSAYRVSAARLPSPAGTVGGAVVALHDITDELNALAQREDFVSSVSHELRTPLTSITGYLDLALDDPDLPAHTGSYLTVAQRNAARLGMIIDNLLTAARTGADAGGWEPVDLGEVVADVVESIRPPAEDRGLTIGVDAPGRGVVRGDAGRLTQVVSNVVSNAVKYTDPGGRIDVALDEPETGRVRLVVSDDGPGISEEAQDRLFTRFYRAPEVRNSAVQGTGLGLHISRQIVQAHGGTITLQSAPGRGTRVEILLPAWEDA